MTDGLRQLAPTGKLRGGVVVSPAASAFFAVKDAQGAPHGVTVDLLQDFARALKLELALQVYDNSGQVTDAIASGACDVSFMPRDAMREGKVDFGPAYYFISSTYLVPAGSKIKTIDEVNRPGAAYCRHFQHHDRAQRAPHRAQCQRRGSSERRSNDRNGGKREGRRFRADA